MKNLELKTVPARGKNDKIVQIMDSVHNFIDISEYPVIHQLIDTPHFQRLRRLCQLGLASMVYPNATHSRFAHSIGVMHVFLILFDSVTKKSNLTNVRIKKLRPLGAVAALLHDIGHGPFSHTSEKFLNNGNFRHEDLTQKIIRSTDISKILNENNIKPQIICDILQHRVSKDLRFVSQLISSQLDADRLDYLMRDALFTGAPYGKIDLYRIANTLSIWNNDKPKKTLKGTIVVSKKGIEAIEHYLIGRHHMYNGVYYHKTVRCLEHILTNIFKRAFEIKEVNSKIINTKNITPEKMLTLDDHICYSLIDTWSRSNDKILKKLSTDLIKRNLLKSRDIDTNYPILYEHLADIKKEFNKKNINFKYFFVQDSIPRSGYKPYVITETEDTETAISHIMVNKEKNMLQEISTVSPLVKAISQKNNEHNRIFYPKKDVPQLEKILTQYIK